MFRIEEAESRGGRPPNLHVTPEAAHGEYVIKATPYGVTLAHKTATGVIPEIAVDDLTTASAHQQGDAV